MPLISKHWKLLHPQANFKQIWEGAEVSELWRVIHYTGMWVDKTHTHSGACCWQVGSNNSAPVYAKGSFQPAQRQGSPLQPALARTCLLRREGNGCGIDREGSARGHSVKWWGRLKDIGHKSVADWTSPVRALRSLLLCLRAIGALSTDLKQWGYSNSQYN